MPEPFVLTPVLGLSPRMRGNLVGDLQRIAGDGPIPANAGEPLVDKPYDLQKKTSKVIRIFKEHSTTSV